MYTFHMANVPFSNTAQFASLKDRIYWQLKQMILQGIYAPGQKIVEEEVAKKLDVSRTPVREAVNRLTAERLLESTPQRGSYCRRMSRREISDLLDVRLNLESLAVAEFIRHADTERINHLEEINRQLEAALADKDYEKCNRLDFQFHHELAKGSGNDFLIELLERTGEFVQLIRLVETELLAYEKNHAAMKDHDELISFLKLRHTDESIRCIRKNINHMRFNIGLED